MNRPLNDRSLVIERTQRGACVYALHYPSFILHTLRRCVCSSALFITSNPFLLGSCSMHILMLDPFNQFSVRPMRIVLASELCVLSSCTPNSVQWFCETTFSMNKNCSIPGNNKKTNTPSILEVFLWTIRMDGFLFTQTHEITSLCLQNEYDEASEKFRCHFEKPQIICIIKIKWIIMNYFVVSRLDSTLRIAAYMHWYPMESRAK